MSGSNCYFLTHTQVSQQTGKEIWYFHLFKNFPQCVMIYTVNGLRIVNKEDIFFLELLCFLHDSTNVGNVISGSSTFSTSSLYIWKFLVHILLKPSLKDFQHNLVEVKASACNVGDPGSIPGLGKCPGEGNGN